MKKQVLIFLCCLYSLRAIKAQNTFPASGNVGIGTATPRAALHILSNTRDYYADRMIAGTTEDAKGDNYILLHPVYVGTPLAEHFVLGRISGIRGSTGALNRKWTVEVNTASAYKTNLGSIVSYNEAASLVTLVFNDTSYLAVKIKNGSTLTSFSFTGYAKGESLQLIKDDSVSAVQDFTSLNPITIQGSVGIGTTAPTEMLSVKGNIKAQEVKVTTAAADWPDYVFQPAYKLTSLDSLAIQIKALKHLPGMPSAGSIREKGMNVGEIIKLQQQKIEELTLYLLKQQNQIEELLKQVQNISDKTLCHEQDTK